MAPHSSTLAWKIPWTEEPGRLQTMGSRRVGHDWATSLSLFTFMHWRRKWQPTPVFLPGESQGQGSLVSRRLWGRTVGHDWSDLAAAAAALSQSQNYEKKKKKERKKEKKITDQNFLHAKNHFNILANWIQQCIRLVSITISNGFYARISDLFNIWKSIDVIYHINRIMYKIHIHHNRWRKSIWQYPTPW